MTSTLNSTDFLIQRMKEGNLYSQTITVKTKDRYEELLQEFSDAVANKVVTLVMNPDVFRIVIKRGPNF